MAALSGRTSFLTIATPTTMSSRRASIQTRTTSLSGQSTLVGSSYSSTSKTIRSGGRGGQGNIKRASMIAKRASMLSFDLDASPAAVEKAESVIGREVVSKSSGEKSMSGRGGSGNLRPKGRPLPAHTAAIMARVQEREHELIAESAASAGTGTPGRSGRGNQKQHLRVKGKEQAPSVTPPGDGSSSVPTGSAGKGTIYGTASLRQSVLGKLRATPKRPRAASAIDLCASTTDLRATPLTADARGAPIASCSSADSRSPLKHVSHTPDDGDTASISAFSTTSTYASSITVHDPDAEHLKKFGEEQPDDDRATLWSITSNVNDDDGNDDAPSPIIHTEPEFLASVAIPRMLNCVPVYPTLDPSSTNSHLPPLFTEPEMASTDSQLATPLPSPVPCIRLHSPAPALFGRRPRSHPPLPPPTSPIPALPTSTHAYL